MMEGKKLISVFLAASMVIQPMSQVSVVRADELITDDPAADTAQELDDAILAVNELYSEADIEKAGDREFGTKTLILSTDQETFDLQGAEDMIGLGEDLYALSYPTPEAAKAAYDTYRQMEGILFVEPDAVIGTEEEESGTEQLTQESTEKLPDATELSAAAAKEAGPDAQTGAVTGTEDATETAKETETPGGGQQEESRQADASPLRIAVVDTGVDVTLEKTGSYLTGFTRDDILSRIRQIPGSEPDTEGFVSEAEVTDENGHGTQVTGLIVDALSGAGIGSDRAEILPVKVAGADGRCTVLQLYLGIERAVTMKSDLINVSMGAYHTAESAILKKAAVDAAESGIPVVVSAGNNGSDVSLYAPANIPSVITAGAVDRNMTASDFSNRGETVDCVSYGEDLTVTGLRGQTETADGTSYAAALVTGALAAEAVREKEAGGKLTPEAADTYIRTCARDLGEPGWDEVYGYGQIGSYTYADEPDAGTEDTEEAVTDTQTGTEDVTEADTEETADAVIPSPDSSTGAYADSGELTEDEKREMYACLSFGDIVNDINCIAETGNIYAASELVTQAKKKAADIREDILAGYVTDRYFAGNGFVSCMSYEKTGMEQTDAAGDALIQILLSYGKSGSEEDEQKFEKALDEFYNTLNSEKSTDVHAQSAELSGMIGSADAQAGEALAAEKAVSVQAGETEPYPDTADMERTGELTADGLYEKLSGYSKEQLRQFYEGLSDSDSTLFAEKLGARYQEVMARICEPEVSVQSAGDAVHYVGDEATLRMYSGTADDGMASVQGVAPDEGKHGTISLTNNITVNKYYSTNGNLTITSSTGKSLKLGDAFRNQKESMIYTYSNTVTIKGNVVLDGQNIPHNGFFVWNNGTLNIQENCVLKNHSFHNIGTPNCNGGYGSAIHSEGICNISGGTFQNNYIENKTAPGGGGGAVCSQKTLTITGGTMTDNAGASGGAIWVRRGTASISGVNISANHGQYGSVFITDDQISQENKDKHKVTATCTISGGVKIHGDTLSDGIRTSQGGRLVLSAADVYIYNNAGAGIRNGYTADIKGAAKIGFSGYSKIDDYTVSVNAGGALINSDTCTISAAARFFGGAHSAISNSGTLSISAGADASAFGTTADTVVNNSGSFTASGYDKKYSLSVFSAESDYGVKNTGKMSFGGNVDGRYKVTSGKRGSDTPVKDKNGKAVANHAFKKACILNDSTKTISADKPYALIVNGNYVVKNGDTGVKVNKGKASMTSGSVTSNENAGFYIASGASADINGGTFASNGSAGISNAGTCNLTGDNIYSYGNKGNGYYNAGTMNISGKVKAGFSEFTDNTDYKLSANSSHAVKNAGTMNISDRVYLYGGAASALSNTGTCVASGGYYISNGASDCVYNSNSLTMSGALVFGTATNGIHSAANSDTKIRVTTDITDTEVRGQYTIGDTGWTADKAKHNITMGISNGAGTMTVTGGVVRNASGNGITSQSGTTTEIAKETYLYSNNGKAVDNAGTCNITGNAKIGFSDYKSMTYTSGTTAGKDSGYVTAVNGSDAVANAGTMDISGAVRIYAKNDPAVNNSGTLTFKKDADTSLLAHTDGDVIVNSGTLTAEAKSRSDAKPSCTVYADPVSGAKESRKTCGISNTGTLNWGGVIDGGYTAGANGRTGSTDKNIRTGIRQNSSKKDKNGNEETVFTLYDNALVRNCGTGIYANKGKTVLNAADINNNNVHGIEVRAAAQLHISGADIHDNTCADVSGGGIYNLGKLYFNSGSIRNNTAHTYGGGIMNKAGADFRMYGGTISGNTADGMKSDGNVNKDAAGDGIHNEAGTATALAGTLRLYGGYIHGNSGFGISNRGTVYIATQETPKDNKDIRFHMGVSAYSNWKSYTVSANTKGNIYNEGLLQTGKADAEHNYARLISNGNTNICNAKGGTINVLANTKTDSQVELYGTGTGIENNGGTVTLRTGFNITSASAQARTGIRNVSGTVTMQGGKITKGTTGVDNDGTFAMTGGTISGNSTHGVVQNSLFTMSGGAAVDSSNDVCLAYGRVITINGALTTDGVVAKVTPVKKNSLNQDVIDTSIGRIIATTTYSGGKGSAALFYDSKQSARFVLSNGGILRPGDYMDQGVLKDAGKKVAATDIAISETYGITYDKNLADIPVTIPKAQDKFWCENVKLVLADPVITDAARAPQFQFLHWNDKADDTGSIYVDGQTYKKNNSVTIYAQWQNNINFSYIGNEQEQGNDYTDERISQSEEYTFGDNQDDAGNEYFDKTATKSYTDEETGSEVEEEVECTVVGWRLGNNVDYNMYTLGEESVAGNIYTSAQNVPGAVTYGAPSSDYGSHNPAAPFALDNAAGNGKTDGDLFAGSESMTGKSFLSPFVGGIPYINLYAVWDEGPLVEAYDLYYDLAFAQSTTDTTGITMDELLSHARAQDIEDGTLAPGADIDIGDGKKTSFIVQDYQASDFTGFTTDGTVSVTYQATDSAGNVTRKRINVHLIDTTPQEVKEGKVRFISSKYLNKAEADGGLAADSVWNTRSDYHDLLTSVLSNEKTGTETADGMYFGQDISIEKPGSGTWTTAPEETWEFTHEEVQAVKAYIDANGIGNSRSDSALSGFTSSFASCKK